MGVATGCGFKEIYRFTHTTYPYSSCICTFLQQHPYFLVHFYKCFSFFIINDYKDTIIIIHIPAVFFSEYIVLSTLHIFLTGESFYQKSNLYIIIIIIQNIQELYRIIQVIYIYKPFLE